MSTIKIAANGTITLPAKLRKALGLATGDLVSAELRGGRIVIKPVKVVDADEAWFYTKRWQKMEAEADRDIARGRVKVFNSVEELLKDLHKK